MLPCNCADWQAATGAGARNGCLADGGSLSGTDSLAVHASYVNTLDVAVHLQLDAGDGQRQVVTLPPHAATPVLQPMPLPPLSHAPQSSGQPPALRLLVDLLCARTLGDGVSPGAPRELVARLAVAGRLAAQLAPVTQGMETRAMAAPSLGAPTVWNERFVVPLPLDLVEQLLLPAPGDNPFAGTALELALSLMDGSGERGVGRILGCATASVPYDWLLAQVAAGMAARLATPTAVAGGGGDGKQKSSAHGMMLTLCVDGASSSSSSSAAPPSCATEVDMVVSLDDSQVSSSWLPQARAARQYGRSARLTGTAAGGGRRSNFGSASDVGSVAAASRGTSWMRQALRLEGSEVWSPFSYAAVRQIPGAPVSPHAGVVPIRAGQGLVLELAYTGEFLSPHKELQLLLQQRCHVHCHLCRYLSLLLQRWLCSAAVM
jgi:vacuolar protein sorting-associated protein 13A/C